MKSQYADARRISHPIYNVWKDMRRRCLTPSNKEYKNYGGRGITICERWSEFLVFASDMGPRPDGMTLERIDNEAGYSPENCRWASRDDQVRNTRRTRLTPERVMKIRQSRGIAAAKKLATEYGTSVGYVLNVRSGIGWNEVKP